MSIYKLAITFWVTIFFSYVAICCPCGCGAHSVLGLSLGETFKTNLGVTREFGFKTVTNSGRSQPEHGPQSTTIMNIDGAYALYPSCSIGMSLPFAVNSHDSIGNDYSLRDPKIELRWDLNSMSILSWWQPQVDLYSSYKLAIAKSMSEPSQRKYNLDMHGNGFNEGRIGLQALWQSLFWFTGINFSMGTNVKPKKVKVGNNTFMRNQGLSMITTLNCGYRWVGYTQLGVSLERISKTNDSISSSKDSSWRKVLGSKSLAYNVSLNVQVRVKDKQTAAISIKRNAVAGNNYNVTQNTAIGVSYAYAI